MGRLSIWATILLASMSVYALTAIKVDNKSSKISFSGEHVGMKFTGVFEKWDAQLVLPPQENPSITASFDLSSAKTGDFTYDSTLPEGDWFDVENHPQGSFVSSAIELVEGGYKVSGKLTLRGVSKTQTFVLRENGGKLSADFPINRLDYAIGFDSDPDAEWVSKDIIMSLKLQTK